MYFDHTHPNTTHDLFSLFALFQNGTDWATRLCTSFLFFIFGLLSFYQWLQWWKVRVDLKSNRENVLLSWAMCWMNIQTLPEIRTISCWPGLLPSSVHTRIHTSLHMYKNKIIMPLHFPFLIIPLHFFFFFVSCYVFYSFLPKPLVLPPFWTPNPATVSQPISLLWPLSAIFSHSFLSFIYNNIHFRDRVWPQLTLFNLYLSFSFCVSLWLAS